MKNFMIILALVCSILLFSGCISNNTGLFGLSENQKTVKIGVILPLTGTSSDMGQLEKNGLELAQKEINSDPKNKYKINLIFEDSQYDNKIAITCAQKLISTDNVKFIIGDHGSSQTLAIATITEPNKVILISPYSNASNISSAGDYVFRTSPNSNDEINFFAKYILKVAGNNKVGIIALNTDYGKTYIDEFKKRYSGTIGYTSLYGKEIIDFTTDLLKAKNSNTNYIILVANRQQGGLILKQAKELNLDIKLYATSSIEGQDLITIAGNAANGLIYPYPYDNNSTNAAQKNFRNLYYKEFNKNAEYASASSYDDLILLSKCFESIGTNADDVKNCLYNTQNYYGASGILSFDKNGDVKKEFTLKTVKDSKFVKLIQ